MPYLIFADHESEFDRRELYANSRAIIIGRAGDCDVPVRDILLSRHHCRLDPLGNRWVVTDLASKNGTRVDGRPIERHVLRDGEVVRAGRTRICFRAGAFEPAPPGSHRSRAARPVDPVEAMAGTVTGFHLGDMEEDSKISGFPIPRPRPVEPASYRNENLGAMLAELSSISWDRRTMIATETTTPPRRAHAKNRIEHDRHSTLLVRPPAPRALTSIAIASASASASDQTMSRWRIVISIGLAIGVCAAALAVIAVGWFTQAPVR